MAKKVAFFGVFAALALIMGYVERFLIPPFAVPGIKLGLANVIVLITLYYMGTREAFGLLIIRITLSGLLFGGLSSLIYSMAGGLVSYSVMTVLKRTKFLGIVGISVAGAIFHNAAQICVAVAIVENAKLFYYLPVLITAGVAAGVVTGFIASYTLNYLQRKT